MKRILKYIVIVISITFISGCGKNIAVISDKDIENLEVYSSIKYSDLIDITDGYIVEDKTIELTEIGNIKIDIEYKDTKKHKGTYTRYINVVDTTKPILSVSSNISKIINSEFNLCDMAFFGDNYDRDLTCEIVGDYDNTIVGSYPLVMKVTDSSGNEIEKEIVLKIVNKYSSSNYVSEGYKIEEAIKEYKTDNTSIGIDVSSYQGVIDWQKVKNSGVEFAMIRIGYGYNNNWELVLDKYFKYNLDGAKAVGLKVGVYFYTYANTLEEIDSQIDFVMENLEGTPLELGIAFDFENWTSFSEYKINFYNLNKMYEKWKSLCEEKGYKALLYGSKYYLVNVWDTDNEDIWLAHYTSKTNYDKDYVMWQFSNEGIVPGIDAYVDLDILKQE